MSTILRFLLPPLHFVTMKSNSDTEKHILNYIQIKIIKYYFRNFLNIVSIIIIMDISYIYIIII